MLNLRMFSQFRQKQRSPTAQLSHQLTLNVYRVDRTAGQGGSTSRWYSPRARFVPEPRLTALRCFMLALVALLATSCAEQDSESASPPGASPGSVINVNPDTDRCCRNEQELQALLGPRCECDEDDAECVLDDETCDALDLVCDPLRSMTCSGTYRHPPEEGVCPAPSVLETSSGLCMRPAQRICTTDEQCPNGSFCDLASGGICQFTCLPDDTCEAAASDGIQCCGTGEFCDCRGRCVASDFDSALAPVLQLPSLNAFPTSLEITRSASIDSTSGFRVDLSRNGLMDEVSVRVVAPRGLTVACIDGEEGTVPADTAFVQACELVFAGEPEPKFSRNVWVRLNEPATTEGRIVHEIALLLVAGPQLVKTEALVVVADPVLEPEELELQGVCEGTLSLVPAVVKGQGIGVPESIYARRDNLLINPIPVTARVTIENSTWPSFEYTGEAVRVVFLDSSHALSEVGNFARTWLVPASEVTGTQLSRTIDVVGDGPFVWSDSLDWELRESPEEGELSYDSKTGVLTGGFVLRQHLRSTGSHVGDLLVALDLTCDGEVPSGTSPVYELPAEPSVSRLEHQIVEALSPSYFPSWAGWMEAARSGTVVSCGVGMGPEPGAFAACLDSLGRELESAEADPEAICSLAYEALEDGHFVTPPFAYEIAQHLFVPCDRTSGSTQGTQCDATCSDEFDVSVSFPGAGTKTIGFCPLDRPEFEPTSGETLAHWQSRRSMACSHRFVAYDPADGFEQSAADDFSATILPISREPALERHNGTAIVPVALGLAHWADRAGLGAAENEATYEKMAQACIKDLSSPLPPPSHSTTDADLQLRMEALFRTRDCIGRPQLVGAMFWAQRAFESGHATAGAVLMKRVTQVLQAALFAIDYAANSRKAKALIGKDDEGESEQQPEAPVLELAKSVQRLAAVYIRGVQDVPASLQAQSFLTAVGLGNVEGVPLRESLLETVKGLAIAFSRLSGNEGSSQASDGGGEGEATIMSTSMAGVFDFLVNSTGEANSAVLDIWSDLILDLQQKVGAGLFNVPPCEIWDDGSGLCDSTDVPIYFVDPAGTNSKFFATSDYLLDNWARPAFAEASAAVERLRGSLQGQLDRKLSMSRAEEDYSAEIDTIKERFGSRLASLCGYDRRRLEGELLGTATSSGSVSEQVFDASFGGAIVPADLRSTSPFRNSSRRCFVEYDRPIIINGESSTCGEFISGFSGALTQQARCAGINSVDLTAVRTLICTAATIRAMDRVGQNAPESMLDEGCAQMTSQEVWNRSEVSECSSGLVAYPTSESHYFQGVFRAVRWAPWISQSMTSSSIMSVVGAVEDNIVGLLQHGSIPAKSSVGFGGFGVDPWTAARSEDEEDRDRPSIRSVDPIIWSDHKGVIDAPSDWTWSGRLQQEAEADAVVDKLQHAERHFGLPVHDPLMPFDLLTLRSIGMGCDESGSAELRFFGKATGVTLVSGWWEPLEFQGFPECTWPGAQMGSFFEPSEFLPPAVGGIGSNGAVDVWDRLDEKLGLAGVENDPAAASGVPLFYVSETPNLAETYETFGGRHVAYQPEIESDLAALENPDPAPTPGGCQAYLHGRSLAAIYSTCREYSESIVADSQLPQLAGDSVDAGSLPQCLHGEMGHALLQIYAARSRMITSRTALAAAQNGIAAQAEHCIYLENLDGEVIDAKVELDDLRESSANSTSFIDVIVGIATTIFATVASVGMMMATKGSAAPVVGTFLSGAASVVGGAVSDRLGQTLLEAENAFEALQLKVEAAQSSSGCWLEVAKGQYQVNALTTSIQTDLLEVARNLVVSNQLQQEFESQRDNGAQAILAAVDRHERLRGIADPDVTWEELRPAEDISLRTIEALSSEVLTSDQERAVRQLQWAMKMLSLVVRAAEHEGQSTISFSDDMLSRTLDAVHRLGNDPKLVTDVSLADLDALLRAVEIELATRTVGGARPDEKAGVLSLRDDLLALSDHSCDDFTCALECEAEHRPDPIDRLRTALTDPRHALYDDQGKYIGQGIPFALTPQSELLYRCAERIWSVAASVEGDLLSLQSPSVPLFILKHNSFESQWCGDPSAHGELPRQVGSWRPMINHFRDIDDASMPMGETYAWSHIDAWVNVRRSDLYKDGYAEGGSDELAGRGLYGNYLLVFPYHGLLDQGSAILNQIDDVLIRVDYISVSNGSKSVDFAGVSGLSGGSPTLLPPGDLCVDPDECITGFCVDARCCTSACTGACRSCSLSGECEARPPGTPTSGCGNYAFCGGGGECMTSCEDHATCSTQAFCNPGEGPSPTGTCIAKYAPGQGCEDDVECASGVCVDGVCCAAECDGPCETCSAEGNVGQCVAVPLGSEEPLCGAYVYCDDAVGGACATSCEGHLDCTAGHYCNSVSDQCEPVQELGASCYSPEECESAYCANGRCCDSACDGVCEACDVSGSVGECVDVAAGSEHPECAPFLCEANGVCPATCDAHYDCMDGYYCSPSTETCVEELAQGASCAFGYQCGSGNCIDDRCCDTTCGSTCFACNIAGSLGTCTAQAAGATCGNPSCSNSELTPQPQCNSSQQCITGSASGCANALTCADGESCRSSCTTTSHCVTGYFCCQAGYDCASNGACNAKKAESASCNNGDECQSGSCVSNACTAP